MFTKDDVGILVENINGNVGVITAFMDEDDTTYPVTVTYTNNSSTTYTEDGKEHEGIDEISIVRVSIEEDECDTHDQQIKESDHTFTKADVGLIVYTNIGGQGVITAWDDDSEYPVEVTYRGNLTDDFTADGKLYNEIDFPSIFRYPVKTIITSRPEPTRAFGGANFDDDCTWCKPDSDWMGYKFCPTCGRKLHDS